LVLHRIDPEQGIRRFYSLMIERDLFGTIRLVHHWGRIGTNGQELVEIHTDEIEASKALEAIAGSSGGEAIRTYNFAEGRVWT
jgi:predicted DNA-binding WGR domain protein